MSLKGRIGKLAGQFPTNLADFICMSHPSREKIELAKSNFIVIYVANIADFNGKVKDRPHGMWG